MDEGVLYMLGWFDEELGEMIWCLMNEEFFKLIFMEMWSEIEFSLNVECDDEFYCIKILG